MGSRPLPRLVAWKVSWPMQRLPHCCQRRKKRVHGNEGGEIRCRMCGQIVQGVPMLRCVSACHHQPTPRDIELQTVWFETSTTLLTQQGKSGTTKICQGLWCHRIRGRHFHVSSRGHWQAKGCWDQQPGPDLQRDLSFRVHIHTRLDLRCRCDR